VRVGADGLDVVDAGFAGAGNGDAADGTAPVAASECLLPKSSPGGGVVKIPAAAVARCGHRKPGMKMNKPNSTTAMNAIQLLAQAYGVTCGTGMIDKNHRKHVTTKRISRIMAEARAWQDQDVVGG
jgi:hypothetical protein